MPLTTSDSPNGLSSNCQHCGHAIGNAEVYCDTSGCPGNAFAGDRHLEEEDDYLRSLLSYEPDAWQRAVEHRESLSSEQLRTRWWEQPGKWWES